MEKRAVLALVLCGLVLVIHMAFVQPLLRPPAGVTGAGGDNVTVPPGDNVTTTTPTPTPTPTPAPVPTPSPTPTPTPTPTPAGAVYVAADQDKIAPAQYTLESPLITATWTNAFTGACLDVTFNEFYETVAHEKRLKLVGAFESLVPVGAPERKPLAMVLEFPELDAALANMKMQATESPDGGLVFRGTILRRDPATGQTHPFLGVTKTVRASTERYELEVDVELRNLTGVPMSLGYDVRILEGITVEEGWGSGATARVGLLSEKGHPMLKDRPLTKLKDKPWREGTGNVIWAGLDDRYFAALLFAEGRETMDSATVEPIQVRLVPKGQPVASARVTLASRLPSVAPETPHIRTYRLFIGPKQNVVLEQYANLGFPQMVDFGMFGIISHLLLWVLRGLYAVVRNYGVAIILLTVMIRVALHGFTRKSQVAMHKMQRLKPKIQELQKKYKNDKQKLGQEQMALFRKHGVSPLSGCLPMLLQMPILFALFWALRLTFELRQSPFALWITDLSRPDTVGHFPAGIPLIGGAPLNILPLLMTVAMYLQQKMMPKADDPQSQQQQKFMGLLPFLFAFLFYRFPSGLCLYWFTSTVLGMGEQYFIKKHLEEMEEAGVPEKPADAAPSFMERLTSRKSVAAKPKRKKKK